VLTSDEVEDIVLKIMNGVPLGELSEEAELFRKQFVADLAMAKKNRWAIELPFELPKIGAE